MNRFTVVNKRIRIGLCPNGSEQWFLKYYVKSEKKTLSQCLYTKGKTEAKSRARQLYQKLVGIKTYAQGLKVISNYRSAYQANIKKQLAEHTKNIKENTQTCKTKTLFSEIVHKYHPEFKSKSMLKLVEKHPGIFNVGHLIELTMAEVGGYDVVDGHGYDGRQAPVRFSSWPVCRWGGVREGR